MKLTSHDTALLLKNDGAQQNALDAHINTLKF